MRQFFFACLALLIHRLNAQTTTVVTGGLTVIEVVTTDPNGRPATQILQTLTGSTAATTATTVATTVATTDDGQQGPVGQPAPTTTLPNGVTPYTYTTVNANGITTAVVDNFTPSFPATVAPTVGTSGTILNYSSWLSIYGQTSTTSVANAAVKAGLLAQGWWGMLIGVLTGAASGVLLVLL